MSYRMNFSSEDIDRIVLMYSESSMSCRDISIIFGCGKNTIRSVLINKGVSFDRNAKIAAKSIGRPSARKGATHSDETKLKMSESAKGNTKCVGRVLSEETKAKISEAHKGKKLSPESIAKRTATLAARHKKAEKPAKPRKAVGLPVAEREARSQVRGLIKRLIRRVVNLTGKKKASRSFEMLGYSQAELRYRIESQFYGEMSWENRSSFHIDHIVPVVAFIEHGITDTKIINSLCNLRPMSPKENQLKSDKYDRSNFQSDLDRIIAFNSAGEIDMRKVEIA